MKKIIFRTFIILVIIFVALLSMSDNLRIDVYDDQYPVMIKFDDFKISFLVILTLAYMTVFRIIFAIWNVFDKNSFAKYIGDLENTNGRFGIFLLTYVFSLFLCLATSDFILSYYFTF
jgi:hypothetical protein